MSRLRTIAIAVVVVVAGSLASPLFAGNCSWYTTPTSMTFNYSVFSAADATATTPFGFRCTPNQWARVTLTPVSIPYRNAGGADYNIYLDPGGAPAPVWGDGVSGGTTYDKYYTSPGNTPVNDTMYGIAPAGQDLAGTYQATLIAQLSTASAQTGPWTTVGAGVQLTVTIIVAAECRVDSFNLSFGQYDPFSTAPLSRSSLVKVYCTRNTSGTASLDNGLNWNGSQRRMISPAGAYLNYDAALSGLKSGTSTSSLVPLASGFPLSGTVSPQQDVPVNSYKDTLQAIIVF